MTHHKDFTPPDLFDRVRDQSDAVPPWRIPFKEAACAYAVRTMYEAPSSGDADDDGDSDAVDVYVRAQFKHRVSRLILPEFIPRGVPLCLAGGSKGNGHEVIVNGFPTMARHVFDLNVWSTDIKRIGRFDLVPLGLVYDWMVSPALLGWVEDIGGKRVYHA